MIFSGNVGIANYGDGTVQPIRMGRQGDMDVSELHGRFYEQNFRGNLFIGGMTLTAINNATFTTGTLTASCTPILGLFNPSTSSVNAVVLQVSLAAVLTALTATGPGGFVWASSVGNTAVSTGSTPLNGKTLQAAGSQVKFFAASPALTGLTNNLTVQFGSALNVGQPYNISEVATAAGFMTQPSASVENLDGSLFCPPGGVIALLATTTPVAHSVVGAIRWEEVSV